MLYGHNDGVKARSELLKQYGEFVDMIHQYQKDVPIQEATKLAIEYCIKNGILKEFLEKERDAVMSNILYEYDEAATLAYIAEEQYGLGISQGISQGIKELIDALREFGASENQIMDRLIDKFQITIDEAKEYMMR